MENQLLGWLSGGDLRSDGDATEVAELVLDQPDLFGDLIPGLDHANPVVRGRTADVLEKVARVRPGWVNEIRVDLLRVAEEDPVPMVRWHLAMVLGYLLVYPEHYGSIYLILIRMLADESVFVRSWVITSLTIAGRLDPERCEEIVQLLVPLLKDESVAIRTRAKKALAALTDAAAPLPKGWIKSEHLRHL
jgi:HEAT repeat protein